MTSRIISSPIGAIALIASDDALQSVSLVGEAASDSGDDNALLNTAEEQFAAYFATRLRAFNLPLAPAATARGEELRSAIAAIAYGSVASYGEIARCVGSAPRAVGQACKRNRFPIIIPCHRVIATGGAIGYYSGGKGIATKRFLLDMERREEIEPWAA